MIAHELPERPWQNVVTALFMLENEQYLIVVDYYSRYFELERMSTTTSTAINYQQAESHFCDTWHSGETGL